MGLFSLDDEVRVPCFCSQRWILAYTAFLGFVCLYAVRFNLSVAIVCMVRTEPKNNSATESVNHTAGLCTGTVESVKLSNQVTLF
jgi:sugar phosphate permease